MEKLNLDLQLFADGGAGAAGGDGGAAAGAGTTTGVQAPDAGEQRQKKRVNPLANTRYGIQPRQEQAQGEVAATTEAAANTADQDNGKKSFEDLIKGEYKADFDARVQEIIRNRFKQNGEMEEKLNSMNPLLEMLGKKHNVDPTDIEQLTRIIGDDDSLYEEEAIQRGMSVETLKTVKQMERENELLKQREQQSIAEQRMHEHFDGLARQAEALKQLYPSFNLMAEMQNPQFARLTAPGVNVDVRTAYEVVHNAEIQSAGMQVAAQKSAERVANAVRANGTRPMENGMNGQQTPSLVKTDPRTLTKADLAEISKRVARGEKIAF